MGETRMKEELIRRVFGQGTQLGACEVRPAVPPGSNHCSDLYRVSTNGRSVIVKLRPEKEPAFINDLKMFEKESCMYNELLPDVAETLGEDLGPRRVAVEGETLVLEDLVCLGFRNEDRCSQLDEAHARAALLHLGKFHAATQALMTKHTDRYAQALADPQAQKKKEGRWSSMHYIRNCYLMMSKMLHNWGEDDLGLKVAKLAETNVREAMLLNRARAIGVVAHGDLWTNNIMFQHGSDGTITQVRFLDFQLSRLTSPCADLCYFFLTSVRPQVRLASFIPLLSVYLDSFNRTAALTGAPSRMTLDWLLNELVTMNPYAIQTLHIILPSVLAHPKHKFELKAQTDIKDNQHFSFIYEGEPFKKIYLEIIARFFQSPGSCLFESTNNNE